MAPGIGSSAWHPTSLQAGPDRGSERYRRYWRRCDSKWISKIFNLPWTSMSPHSNFFVSGCPACTSAKSFLTSSLARSTVSSNVESMMHPLVLERKHLDHKSLSWCDSCEFLINLLRQVQIGQQDLKPAVPVQSAQ